MKIRDASVPVLFMAVILTFIIPVPEYLLDILLAINIALSAIILLNAIYLTDPLNLSVFPSLLVITTIFRLALNITSTKLILGEGKAGKVIEGFGEFVAGDNIVVGFILFIIILLVNFLVITRGAERVAEVAARFTLDAMPGKQMAIDADLNAGLINDQQAKERRAKVQQESDFYGAMDGATKFVKNDAIAGIIITVINMVGGFIIGIVMRGEDFSYALETYTMLTIGDGLVSQMSSLMISIATSFIVTRAAATDSTISKDLIKQLLTNSKVLFITAGLCVILSFFLSTIPFLTLALILAYLGYILASKNKRVEEDEEEQVEEQQVEEIRKPENVIGLLEVDPIELEFGYGIIPLADVNQGGDLLDRVVMIRRQLALELGILVPVIRLRDNIQLNPNEYIIKIKGVDITVSEIIMDHYMAMNPGDIEEELEGIETKEPAFGLPAIWIDESQRERAEMLGFTVVDPPSVIATHLTEIIRKHAHEFTGRQEVQTIIDNVKKHHPAVVDELIPKQMSLGEVQKVLSNLLQEGISIRDMVTILETLADYAPVTSDPDILTEYVRQALGRAISNKFLTAGADVLTLDPDLEQIIMDSIKKTDTTTYIAIEPQVTNTLIDNLKREAQKLIQIGRQPIVLASPVVRLYFKRLTEHAFPDLVVISYSELDPNLNIRAVGVVGLK